MFTIKTQKIFSFILLVLFSSLVYAGNEERSTEIIRNEVKNTTHAIFCGKAIDANTGETLSGVAIKLVGLNKTIYTDFDGNFSVDDLMPGKYNIITSYITYQDNIQEKLELKSSTETRVVFALKTKY